MPLQRSFWRWIAGAIALGIAAVGLHLGWSSSPRWSPAELAPQTGSAASDAMSGFLERHWPDPLPPQGEPPAGFSALEASLGPDACGQCHTMQYADWKASLHSQTMGPGIAWQLHVMSQQGANGCMRCHAPLAEQKALSAIEHRWKNAPAAPPPAHVPPDLHRQGLVCAACHVRRHVRVGPPRRDAAPPPGTAVPHAGFTADSGFQDSRFCAVCHQFPAGGARLNGKLIENTYEEWKASAAAQSGQTCQSCHMPDRRHQWRGIHDADMVRQGLRVSLDVLPGAAGQFRAQAELANVGAGHHLPTYLIPEIVATLELLSPGGSVVAELGRHVVGRKANLELTEELADTRLASGERVSFSGQIPAPTTSGWTVELRVVVHPGKHYEKLFRGVLGRREPLPDEAARLLRLALARTEGSSYELYRVRKAVAAR